MIFRFSKSARNVFKLQSIRSFSLYSVIIFIVTLSAAIESQGSLGIGNHSIANCSNWGLSLSIEIETKFSEFHYFGFSGFSSLSSRPGSDKISLFWRWYFIGRPGIGLYVSPMLSYVDVSNDRFSKSSVGPGAGVGVILLYFLTLNFEALHTLNKQIGDAFLFSINLRTL
jgi:hypothetical protein